MLNVKLNREFAIAVIFITCLVAMKLEGSTSCEHWQERGLQEQDNPDCKMKQHSNYGFKGSIWFKLYYYPFYLFFGCIKILASPIRVQ